MNLVGSRGSARLTAHPACQSKRSFWKPCSLWTLIESFFEISAGFAVNSKRCWLYGIEIMELGAKAIGRIFRDWILIIGLSLIGAVCGVYVASRWFNRISPANGDATQSQFEMSLPKEWLPSFESGDLFPLLDVKVQDGSIRNFEDILFGHQSAVIFVSVGCSVCDDLLSLWTSEVNPCLSNSSLVVICSADDTEATSERRYSSIKNCLTVRADKEEFFDFYRINIFPTIVTVDEYGLVVNIQAGYSDRIDQAILASIIDPEL